MAETDKGTAGTILWLRFGWYPIYLLMYSAGIAALSARKFDSLKVILSTPVRTQLREDQNIPLITAVVSNIYSELGDAFKWIPDHERKHFPRSEHFFEILRAPLEETLFLGRTQILLRRVLTFLL